MAQDNENSKPGRYDQELLQYFKEQPQRIDLSYQKIADDVGISDYRTVKRFIERTYSEVVIEQMKLGVQANLVDETSTTTKTETSGYGTNPLDEPEKILNFQEYCAKYHIPTDKITSAKFVNHIGQQAWNVVCDFTQITEEHLSKYFDDLRATLVGVVTPHHIKTAPVNEQIAYHFYHSDKHVGAETRKNSLYANEWNAKQFELRMMKSLDDYIEMYQLVGRFDKVLIADLGDSVDGWSGKTTRNSAHTLPQNMDNKETFDVYVDVMKKFIEKLVMLDMANSYEFFCTANDNHGGDFTYIVNRCVEEWLMLRFPDVKTSVNKKFIEQYKYGNHVFMMSHGKDEEDMRSGLPLNLDPKTEATINDYIDNHDLHKTWNHFIKGDLHQEAMNMAKKFRYRNVLSLYGSSAWMMTNFGKGIAGISSELVWKNKKKVMPNLVELI